ncbi:MAG: hypothetical protein LBP23_09145 [Treponema sp.]|nr:hypothetical protein [Treponema sp.]
MKERYEYMTREKGIGKKKAIVAVARRLGELIYTILKKRTDYEVRPLRAGRQSARTLAGEALSA